MLPTFVIGLREGLEAALIVGIIAAFLKRNGEPKALRQMWLGVGAAVVLCLAVGIALKLLSEGLPQRQQEMLECVIAAVAVGMITYMILWMNKHSRGLKGELETAAAGALATGSSKALVLFAFLAVLREGFETAVFLLAAFQNSISPTQAVGGIALGIAAAIVLGYLVYRGGTRLNLSRFFRITGIVLVLVAGGLVISALRAAFEAGWLTVGQQTALDLSSVIAPGTVESSLVGGIFGIQPKLAVVELVGWILFVVPMLAVVLWPRSKRLSTARAGRLLVVLGGAGVVAAAVLAFAAPSAPAAVTGVQGPFTAAGTAESEGDLVTGATLPGGPISGSLSVEVLSFEPNGLTARLQMSTDGTAGTPGAGINTSGEGDFTAVGHVGLGGRSVTEYTGKGFTSTVTSGVPATVTGDQLAALNNGRFPIGVTKADADSPMAARFTDTWKPSVYLDQSSGIVVGTEVRLIRTLQITTAAGISLSGGTVSDLTLAVDETANSAQATAITDRADRATTHEIWGQVIPVQIGVFSLILLAVALRLLVRSRVTPPTRTRELVGAR
ncbi:iron transporter [Nakamurella silvestris]|nr:iron transporter [Nakamurella silvestris]